MQIEQSFNGRFQTLRFRNFQAITSVVCLLVLTLMGCADPSSESERFSEMDRSKTKAIVDRPPAARKYQPRTEFDSSGFSLVGGGISKWRSDTSLEELSEIWNKPGARAAKAIQMSLPQQAVAAEVVRPILACSMYLNYEGETKTVYDMLSRLRAVVEKDPSVAREWLYTIVYFQGVTALRQGENENCIACRGESSCILPLQPAAYHQKEWGSKTAIAHFHEYLEVFPDDQQVRWLLNLAHMTLGQYPNGVDSRFRISIDNWGEESPVGAFRDISAETGLDRFNQSGGGIMDDFDRDGLLDAAVTSINPMVPMGIYRNKGNGTFADVSEEANVLAQLGGLFCVQADYNNDGFTDIFIPRGAWFLSPIRPTLLRNEGDGTWTEVTEDSLLKDASNSNSACWADFDNDGDLDVFVCCERQKNRLLRNNGAGQFFPVPESAFSSGLDTAYCKGATWIDINNDGWQDLFLNNLQGRSRLLRNDSGKHFTDVTAAAGILGPETGFACWTWDYDNDGWLDIFATSYDRNIGDVISGMMKPPDMPVSSRLWHNTGTGRFKDRSVSAGVSAVYETMGCNFGDLDNDGWLDFYLGTGDPEISTLIPNRMFHNREGERFAEITGSSRTGSLQKGHSVSFADWDRNGDLDVFVQMGGAIPGDQFHNMLFQNQGTENHSVILQLCGTSASRSAIGARIRIVTAGDKPQTIYSHVSSGSSFGANPLEVHIGTGESTTIDILEIQWSGSITSQTFRNIATDQIHSIIEGRADPISLNMQALTLSFTE